MRLVILLFCSVFVFGQSTSPPPASTEPPASSADLQLAHGCRGNLEILSDTQGIDFGPYLQQILQDIRPNWYKLIPDSAVLKKGKLAIEFAIKKDGFIDDMRLVTTSGDVALESSSVGQHHEIESISSPASRFHWALSRATIPLLLQPGQE